MSEIFSDAQAAIEWLRLSLRCHAIDRCLDYLNNPDEDPHDDALCATFGQDLDGYYKWLETGDPVSCMDQSAIYDRDIAAARFLGFSEEAAQQIFVPLSPISTFNEEEFHERVRRFREAYSGANEP
jgi:hypothetical protein